MDSVIEVGYEVFNFENFEETQTAIDDETDRWLNTFSNNNYVIETLFINIDSEDAKRVNKELEEIAYNTLNTKAIGVKALLEGKWFVSDHVVSLILKHSGSGPHSYVNYQVFNFDKSTGKLLINGQLLQATNHREDIQVIVNEALRRIESDVCPDIYPENCHFDKTSNVGYLSTYEEASDIFVDESGALRYLIDLMRYRENGYIYIHLQKH